ncbi:MAG: 16S rRNA (guanine(966)-N(2))-methyltransferase RsmD [Terriglobia bacterium]
MLRIIAGEYGGRRIRTLRGMRLRPTSDRLRETLFNIIGTGIVGARFLDAYAGCGAIGIEALSRGAAHVTFIEKHFPAVECLRSNLLTLEIKSRFSIIQGDVGRALLQQGEFDICFLDPPYAETQEYQKILTALGSRINLVHHTLVIAEHSRRLNLAMAYGALERVREKTQGDSQLSFYQPQITNPEL